MNNLGPMMKLPNIDVYLPTNSTLPKEFFFGDIWKAYIKVLNTHVHIYNNDEDKLGEIVDEAIEELIMASHGNSDVRRKLMTHIQENNLEIGPGDTLDFF